MGVGHPKRSPSCLGLNSDDFPFFKTLNRTTVAKVSSFSFKICCNHHRLIIPRDRSVRNSGILYIKLMIPLQIPPGPRIFHNFSETYRNFSETQPPTKKNGGVEPPP